MEQISEGFEQQIYQYIDRIKDLLSPEIWQNILLDCSKNEILILWLLYRQEEVNMTQIADYIHVPLNTATGVIARMEKKELVIRNRSAEDKRIVTIRMGTLGKKQMKAIAGEFLYYGQLVMQEFNADEMQLLMKFFDTVTRVLSQERKREAEGKKIKKITIE
ncbi:MAG: MarR family transcriptional regulator [bacterium]|nr:MarR family transcriptional regulator [bacterium]